MPRLDGGRLTYLSLVALRAALAFGSGYIHPDEWFQYGEVLSGDYFGIDVIKTWEFDPTYPCRSIASLHLVGLPFALLGPNPPARMLFATSRLTFLLYSFIIDWSAWRLLPLAVRWKGLLLWAGSGAVLSFSVRSFSNNVEAAMLALSLVALQSLMRSVQTPSQSRTDDAKLHEADSSTWTRWSCLLGIFISVGIFSRFTFAIFALPLGVQYVSLCFQRSSGSKFRWRKAACSLSGAAVCALITAALHIAFDTWYYRSQLSKPSWPPIIVPINAALYNLRSDNLATHGLHPRWLHFFVNTPMIVGIGPWWHCISALFRQMGARIGDVTTASMSIVMLNTIFLSIGILSVQPHQEPRFLLPLVLPCCVLFATSKLFRKGPLLYLTVLQSIAVAVFFGLLHQAGTIPAMLEVHRQLPDIAIAQGSKPIQLLFWRSFMPPRHLIFPALRSTAGVQVDDCQSMPIENLAKRISESIAGTIVFMPSWTRTKEVVTILHNRGLNLKPITPAYLHIDTDHLGESIEAYRQGQSLWQSFSYAAYSVQKSVK